MTPTLERRWRLRAACAAAAAGLFLACGARDEPRAFFHGTLLDGSVNTKCFGDFDCGSGDLCAPSRCIQGTCVALPLVDCSDDDECTEDRCVPETGTCENTPSSYDLDGDGHPAPRPGFPANDPRACGDDCDDTSALAFPGGVERCDGVDNDCNGVIDDGARYSPVSGEPLLLSPGARQAGAGGLNFDVNAFGVLYGAQTDAWTTTFTAFDSDGNITVPSVAVTNVNTDSFAGPLIWNGSTYGAVWEDRRDGDFEIYFNRLDSSGAKLGPDVRVSNAPGFSLRPDLLWDGAGFVVVWHDQRDNPDEKGRIYGQRISEQGALVGENVALTPDGPDADNVVISQSDSGFAIVYNQKEDLVRQLVFRTLSTDLSRQGAPLVLGASSAASADIVWAEDRYVVVWDTKNVVPGPSIMGATLSAEGAVLLPERTVTAGASFARSQAIVSLGDRLLFAWAEERNGSFDLFTKMLTKDLGDQSPPEQVTSGSSDSLGPGLALGAFGAAGMIFADDKTGSFQVYAVRLTCGP